MEKKELFLINPIEIEENSNLFREMNALNDQIHHRGFGMIRFSENSLDAWLKLFSCLHNEKIKIIENWWKFQENRSDSVRKHIFSCFMIVRKRTDVIDEEIDEEEESSYFDSRFKQENFLQLVKFYEIAKQPSGCFFNDILLGDLEKLYHFIRCKIGLEIAERDGIFPEKYLLKPSGEN